MSKEPVIRNANHAPPDRFKARVTEAAESALARDGSVGPLELFREMLLLQPVHMHSWRKGSAYYRILEEHIQVGPAKYEKILRHFHEWVRERGLHPIKASYTIRTSKGTEELQVTTDGAPEREKFYRTHYAPTDLPPKKKARLTDKLTKAPDLTVFATVHDQTQCLECNAELNRGSFLVMERDNPICLECADLSHLVFLPSGDAALSRRARKHSPLSAVVVRFNRSRRRYERRGVLVTEKALAQAEEECVADAPKRAAARARAAEARTAEDREFIESLTQAIREQYPGCPAKEAARIASHAGLRSSGRVGRSAAGRALSPRAVELAVAAHIRHSHTGYDALLMQGVDRQDARAQVRSQIDQILGDWSTG